MGLVEVDTFCVTASDAGREWLDDAVFLNGSEFEGIPVDSPHFGDVCVGCTESGQTYLLAELSKVRVHEEGDVADDLMDDVWFRCVVRRFMVSDVLGAAEDLVGEGIHELSLGENAADRLDSEAGGLLQYVVELGQLGDLLVVDAVGLHELELFLVLPAESLLVEWTHLVVDVAPEIVFLFGILHMSNGS